MATLKIPAPFRPYTEGDSEIELEAKNVEEAIIDLLWEKLKIEDPALKLKQVYWDCNMLVFQYKVFSESSSKKIDLSKYDYLDKTVLIDVQRNPRVKQRDL